MTIGLGYERSSAQRRIDAARLSQQIPELHDHLKSGEINLSQVAMLAKCVRQKEKEAPQTEIKVEEKRELLEQVKSCTLEQSEVLFAQGLNIEIKRSEKKHYQRNGSVRIELTFTREEMAVIQRVKEIISHQNPSPSMSELTMHVVRDFLKRKDPLIKKEDRVVKKADPLMKKEDRNAKSKEPKNVSHKEQSEMSTPVPGSNFNQTPQNPYFQKPQSRYIPREMYRAVFQRDQCCQWNYLKTDDQKHSKTDCQPNDSQINSIC